MYESHWNLDRKPFENDQNVAFFFEDSKHHREAQVRLLYAAEQKKPLALLIGESGVGKSFVCRAAAAQLEKRGYPTARLSAAGLPGDELLRAIAIAFGVRNVAAQRAEALGQLLELLAKSTEKDKHPVLFIDNAECLGDGRCLDELRTLLDLVGEEGQPLLTVVLAGHPRVRGSLKRRPSLVQRLEVGYELLPLEPEEAQAYVLFRLSAAGAPEHLFDEAAIAKAAAASAGYPRLINRICDLALLMGMIEKRDRITAELIDDACREMEDLRRIGSGPSERGERERGERGRGRDRDRDRERGDRDRDREEDDEDEEGGRRKRRRRRRGRGRERGREDEEEPEAGEPEGEAAEDDEEAYGFNADEYRDIESMTEIIQGSLKVVPTSGRRRRGKTGRAERGDPLHYFDSNLEEEEAEEERPAAHADEEGEDGEPKKGRRRRRRRRGGRGRRDDASGEHDEPLSDEAEAEAEDEEAEAESEAEVEERPSRPERAGRPERTERAPRPERTERATRPEPVDEGFAEGLLNEGGKAAAAAPPSPPAPERQPETVRSAAPAAPAPEDDFAAGL